MLNGVTEDFVSVSEIDLNRDENNNIQCYESRPKTDSTNATIITIFLKVF